MRTLRRIALSFCLTLVVFAALPVAGQASLGRIVDCSTLSTTDLKPGQSWPTYCPIVA